MHLRSTAARIIHHVIDEGRSLTESLEQALKTIPDQRDQAFVQAICFGVCRWYERLDVVLQHLLDKPLKAKDSDVYCLLLVGLYQLMDMRVPSHAAVAETVEAVKDFKKIWAKNLINAVLRNYLRRTDEMAALIEKNYVAKYAHPQWMLDALKKAWPEDWRAMMDANNQHPPFALRVNQRHLTRDAYLAMLTDAVIIPETTQGIVLSAPVDVNQLPGFSGGDVSVQDGAAQLAAGLLAAQPGDVVLDACAAPGGKTAHILESQPKLKKLIAIDIEPQRLQSIHENLSRLHLTATCLSADVGDPTSWWDQEPFDRILLDAPCSASGVIRRHPDIKLLRRASDIDALALEQLRLLKAVWPLLKPGGLLVYATCSIFPQENEHVLQQFLRDQTDAVPQKIHANWGKEGIIGRQILPGMHGMDGFYYACLKKTP